MTYFWQILLVGTMLGSGVTALLFILFGHE